MLPFSGLRAVALSFAFVSLASLAACAAPVGNSGAAEGDDVEAATDESAISASVKRLAGTYVGDGGALRGVAFRADGTFTADIDNARVTGTFIAGPKTFTLRAPGTPGAASRSIGRYYYALDAASHLSLTRAGTTAELEPLTDARRLARAKTGILAYIENDFVNTPEFISTFDGITWAQIAARVRADVAAFETSEAYEVFVSPTNTIFAGRVNGLHTEATVDTLGKVTNVYVEID
jgi:hypothetical protein